MQQELELVLRDLLLSTRDTGKVAQNILSRLNSDSLGRRERTVYVAFLLNAGFNREVYEVFEGWLSNPKRFLWRGFLFVLHRSGFRPGRDFLNYFFEAQNAIEVKDQLSSFSQWEELDNRFVVLRSATVRKLEEKAVSRRREIFDKLEFVRDQRMIDEEERLLRRLEEIYPKDPEVARRRSEFDNRWARHVIAEKSMQVLQHDLFERRLALSKQDIDWADQFTDGLEECLRQYPRQAYNFSIGLNFIELYEHALVVLRRAPSDLAADWLRLELLLQARRFIECLDQLHQVEVRYSDNPETTFASTYLRAHILRGLGQVGQAVELLKTIVAIRPGYRSAHTLLLEWSTGGNS